MGPGQITPVKNITPVEETSHQSRADHTSNRQIIPVKNITPVEETSQQSKADHTSNRQITPVKGRSYQ